jgi:subtilisin family serine protease
MIPNLFTSGELPMYHDGMLIMKVRQIAEVTPMGAARAMGISAALESPGLSVLSALERGGMLKSITPLSRQTEERRVLMGVRRGVATMMAVEASDSTDPNAGVSLVEIDKSRSLSEVQSALATDPNVEFVSRVPVRYLVARGAKKSTKKPRVGIAATPPASTMWNLTKILWEQARSISGFKDAQKIKVAVLDTGIERAHPDLKGRVKAYTFLHPDLPTASGEKDIVGHGTHVAGTIAALIGNSLGINGICSCPLHIWKIFTDQAEFASFQDGFQYFVDPIMYRRALADCLDQNMDVINLSIGGPGEPDHQEATLFNALLANGTTIVAAMGNERQIGSPTSYPAAIPGVIAVGATSINDNVASFSNRGNHISVCAPGVGIWSTLPTYPGQFGFQAILGPNGQPKEGKPMKREVDYDSWDGTSMASPHVAAAVALLLANKGKMSPLAVRDKLKNTVDKVPNMGTGNFHPDYGAGRLNLLRLLTQ